MIVETATIFAFSALFLMMVIVTVYFGILFFLWFVMAKALTYLIKPIIKIINHE